MRTKDINMGAIGDLNSFYSLFDEKALELEKCHDILEFILKYKDQTISEDEKKKLKWELEIFLFSFHGSKVFSFSTSNGKNVGEIKQYPELDEIQVEAFKYMEGRASSAKSSILKARYNHLLWKGLIKKHKRFAIAAIDNYITAIKDYYILLKDDLNETSPGHIGRLFENLIALVSEINTSHEDIKQLKDFILFKANEIDYYTKNNIIEAMLKYPKIFKPKDFENVISLFEVIINNKKKYVDDFFLITTHIPTILKVAQKTNCDVKRWHNELGLIYLKLAESEDDEEGNWMKLHKYANAIDAFRLAGNKIKKKEVEKRYFELKPKIRLDGHRIDYSAETIKKLKEFDEELKSKAKYFLKNEPNFIYFMLANGVFFPKYNDIISIPKNTKNDFLKFCKTYTIDINKNIFEKTMEYSDKEDILKSYETRVQDTLLPFLHYIFVYGIKSGHLTYRNLIDYLVLHTWIGKDNQKTDLSGNAITSNWIFQIAPSICEFFVQVQAWGESTYYIPNFILCIDSMTLKIEGLLRTFCDRIYVPTSVGKKNGMKEALIHDLLNDETLKKYFNEDDRLLFDYIFSNEGGLNLRNNVAHAFYSENEYSPDIMILLLSVLLRLGKYNLKTGHA